MELREVLASLRVAWWLPLVGLLVGATTAAGISLLQTPIYTSTTQLFITSSASGTTSDALQGSYFTQDRVLSYARLVEGEETYNRVSDRLGVDPGELTSVIAASVQADTVILDVTVTDPSPERARAVAEAVGFEFPDLVAELETPAAAADSPVKVTVIDHPELPTAPSSPQVSRNSALGAVFGALLGTGLAILRRRLDRSVTNAQEASDLVGAPVIGTVRRDDGLETRHIAIGSEGRSGEDYRQLRANLQFLSVDEPPKVIMISSAVPAEGKTTLTINLALALVDAGRKVTIVEADLRRPKVTRYLGLVGGVGLTNVLAGSADLEEVLQAYGKGGLSVVAAGPTPPNPGELLGSTQMATLIEKLRPANDFILVDAPPLLPVADSSALAPLMDGVLLSVRYGKTHKDVLRQAAVTLERVQARTLGLIMNIVPPRTELASVYGYGYDYTSDAAAKSRRRGTARRERRGKSRGMLP